MITEQSERVWWPQAHYKNAEGVLSFLGLAQPGAPKCNVGGSQSTSPSQLSTLKISPKIGKAMQGKASVLTPSPPAPPCLAPTATSLSHKTPYFLMFYPFSNGQIYIVFTPQTMQFMPDFLPHHFINDSQNSDRQNKLLPFRNGVNI